MNRAVRIASCAAAALIAILFTSAVGARADTDDPGKLNAIIGKMVAEGRSKDALPLAERLLAIVKAHEQHDENDGINIDTVATVYSDTGRYAESEQLYKEAIAIKQQTMGANDPELARSYSNLAALYSVLNRYSEAEPLILKGLAIREKALGPNHADVAETLNNLGVLYYDLGRFKESEPILKRALAIRQRALGPKHPSVALSLTVLAQLYWRGLDRKQDAEPLLKQSLAIYEKAQGRDAPYVGYALFALADFYRIAGRLAEAEQYYKRALPILQRSNGLEHADTAAIMGNMGQTIALQGRLDEAIPLVERSNAIYRKLYGEEHADVARGYNVLAEYKMQQDKLDEAQQLFERSLAIREKVLGPEHQDVSGTLGDLASLYIIRRNYVEAEKVAKRAIEITKKVYGPNSSSTAGALQTLAEIYRDQNRIDESQALITEALNSLQKISDSSTFAAVLDDQARIYAAEKRWSDAYTTVKKASAIILEDAKRSAAGSRSGTSTLAGDAKMLSDVLYGYVLAAHHKAEESPELMVQLLDESYRMAQWVTQSQASAALHASAARFGAGDEAREKLVRERQDLSSEWEAKDSRLMNLTSQSAEERDQTSEAELRDRLAQIDARLGEIDKTLARDYPKFANLATPAPLGITATQAQLRPNETLLLFFDNVDYKPESEASFVWAISKTSFAWVRVSLGSKAISDRVQALRCGLDSASWRDDGAKRCAELLGLPADATPKRGAPLPFDLKMAAELYQALFGQVEPLIEGKQLIIVPSGTLATLPFQVLVAGKDAPKPGDYANADWLGVRQPISVMPSVASLELLRKFSQPSIGASTYIGFGNPLLNGNPKFAGQVKRAKEAREATRCSAGVQLAELESDRGGSVPLFAQSGLADVTQLRLQLPLPETATELCTVAKSLGATDAQVDGAVRLGASATEAEIKKMSDDNRLAGYRIVHFATHGALSGQVVGSAEPGLILTPPEKATDFDDGYLTATEIAGLKMNADWVILSACNTAGGGPKDTNALSGLARAFFYAGARALLVSHWAVNSDATVQLITNAFARLRQDPAGGRAGALQFAMSRLIKDGKPFAAHPSYWAPFVLVGEGG